MIARLANYQPHASIKRETDTSSITKRMYSYYSRPDVCYLPCIQGLISATILNWEKEHAALLAGLPPPPVPECMVDETLAGAVSLANYLTAAISRIATRKKLEAGFHRRIRFLSAALAESRQVVPMMARLQLRELPLTKGPLFAGQWSFFCGLYW